MTLSKDDPVDGNERLKSQLAQLGQKLISYDIIDRQGISRAKVKDIYYDVNNQINLLVERSQIDDRKLSLRILEHTHIYQLDLDNQLILTNLSDRQLENLLIYQTAPAPWQDALTESSLDSNYQINSIHNDNQQQSSSSEIEHITLLEEKLQVARRKRKVGEVVVRKQVETRVVTVPVRREKLIVERIGKNPERLTEVVITEEKVNGFKYEELNDTDSLHITKSGFLDLNTAQELLQAVAQLSSADKAKE